MKIVFYIKISKNMTLIPTVLERQKQEREFMIFILDYWKIGLFLFENKYIVLWQKYHYSRNVVPWKKDPGERYCNVYVTYPWGVKVFMISNIWDTMQVLKMYVQTICTWLAASMWALLLAWGTKRKICITSFKNYDSSTINCTMRNFMTSKSIFKLKQREMMKTKEILTNIVAKHTGKKYKEALTDMERNKWMSPEEASSYGLIDLSYRIINV